MAFWIMFQDISLYLVGFPKVRSFLLRFGGCSAAEFQQLCQETSAKIAGLLSSMTSGASPAGHNAGLEKLVTRGEITFA